MHEILSDEVGRRMLLLGNEAIVRGAIEAGVDVAATYPGTPSSEIGNTLHVIAKEAGMYFEFSTNEMVAMEVAASAAATGIRSLTFMKHVGVNVAADAFMTLAYVGTRGGMVIVTADDPSCHSSQNEQDNRYYARFGGVPMFEPSTPQEAKEMVLDAYEVSEKTELPVFLRTTTRVSHIRGVVEFGPKRPLKGKGRFEKDPTRFVTVPAVARKRHPVLLENLEKARALAEESRFNETIAIGEPGDTVIISCSAAYNYVPEALNAIGVGARVLKLGFTFPLPEKKVLDFVRGAKRVVVIEELEPLIEEELTSLARKEGLDVEIIGKGTGHFSRLYEYTPDIVGGALAKVFGKEWPDNSLKPREMALPSRPPTLCAGCPHRATYWAVTKALGGKKKDAIFATDIGCYTLGIQPPQQMADYLLCMGSSIGCACGFSASTDQPVFGFVGDSTFFHASLPGLVNSVYNRHKLIYVVMDNRTTAMTGHQPNPGMGINGMGEPAPMIDVASIARGIGVEFVETVEPYEIQATIDLFKRALEHDGVSVVITKHPCALLEVRDKRRSGQFRVWQVDQEKCKQCQTCISRFGCPAFYHVGEKEVHISESLCNGCGVCEQVCPFGAIGRVDE